MAKDSPITNTTEALTSFHKTLNALPENIRKRYARFSAANAHLPLNEFLGKWEAEDAGRAQAAEIAKLRREKLAAAFKEEFGSDAVAAITGVNTKGKAD